MIDCNLVLSYNPTPDMATTEFVRRDIDALFENAGEILRMKGRYSPFIYAGNYRSGDNYIPNMSNCIILDFDDGLTIAEFEERADFAYAIGTTKSHKKEKNGHVCERFRVIIPTETAISLNSIDLSAMMTEVFRIFPEADTACKDTARAYSGYEGADVIIRHGEYFRWEPFFERVEKRRVHIEWQKKEKQKQFEKKEFTEDDTKKAMESRFKKIYTSGNRNNATADIILWAKNEKMPHHEIEELVTRLVNMSGDPLDDRELAQMFKYHLR